MRRLWLRPGRLVGPAASPRSTTEGVVVAGGGVGGEGGGGGGGGREGEVSNSWQGISRQEASRKLSMAAGEGSGKEERKIHAGSAWNLKSPRLGGGGGRLEGGRGEEGGGWMAALDSRRRVFPTNTSTNIATTPPPSPLPLPPKPLSSSKPSSATSTPSSASLSFASLSISIDSDKEDDYEFDDYSSDSDDDTYYNNDVPLLYFPNLSPLSLLARHNPFPVSNRTRDRSKNPKNLKIPVPFSGNNEITTLSTLISPRYDIRHPQSLLFSPNRRTNRKSRSTPCSPRTALDPKISLPSPCAEFDFKFPISPYTRIKSNFDSVNSYNSSSNNNINSVNSNSFNISGLGSLDTKSTLISPRSNFSDDSKSPLYSIRSDFDSISTQVSPRRTGLRSTLYSLSNLETPCTLLPLNLPPPFSDFPQSPRSAPLSPSVPNSEPNYDPIPAYIPLQRSQSSEFLSHSNERGESRTGTGQLSADVAGRKRQWGAPAGGQSLGAKWRPRLEVIGEGELAEGGRAGGRARLRLMEARKRGGGGGEKIEED